MTRWYGPTIAIAERSRIAFGRRRGRRGGDQIKRAVGLGRNGRDRRLSPRQQTSEPVQALQMTDVRLLTVAVGAGLVAIAIARTKG